MKRSPLRRKNPMRRSGIRRISPAKATRQARPRKPLRRVSKKLAPKLRQYALQRVQFLQRNPWCEHRVLTGQCCNGATEVHHMCGRGPNLLREETWMAICAHHHRVVHQNPRLARENNYLK